MTKRESNPKKGLVNRLGAATVLGLPLLGSCGAIERAMGEVRSGIEIARNITSRSSNMDVFVASNDLGFIAYKKKNYTREETPYVTLRNPPMDGAVYLEVYKVDSPKERMVYSVSEDNIRGARLSWVKGVGGLDNGHYFAKIKVYDKEDPFSSEELGCDFRVVKE